MNNRPLFLEIEYVSPTSMADILVDQSDFIWLDSAKAGPEQGRYSFLSCDPWQKISWQFGDEADPLGAIQETLNQNPLSTCQALPPFQGGFVGYIAYDVCHQFDRIPLPADVTQHTPDVLGGFYDVVLSYDHQLGRCWIVSTGLPARSKSERRQRALERLKWMQHLVKGIARGQKKPQQKGVQPAISIHSNHTGVSYQKMVQQCQDYIVAGDIFEVNVSQRFTATMPADFDPYQLYRHLREVNAAPFSAFLQFPEVVIASASPERFLLLQAGEVEARPIKGTRPRSSDPAVDQASRDDLLGSDKDRAENIMIVDLMRNDLSKVCTDESVLVPQLCALETFATVHHLVSVVTGSLRPERDAIDLIRASFPGGSITGAPKIRAMQIISELEEQCRGPYCGSVGYVGHNGNMDLSITIRTFSIQGQTVRFQVGGAVVYDSDPAEEYQETLDKARALFCALGREDLLSELVTR